jgi:transmembrane sensor
MANRTPREIPKQRPSLTTRISRWLSLLRKAGVILRPAAPLLLLLTNCSHTGYYSTDIGGQLPVTLQGALLTLNTNSRISVRDTPVCLSVRIFQGEVLFHIDHAKGRCVEVWAGDALISDIGTTFDVYLTEDKVIVTVIDGSLELAKVSTSMASAFPRDSATVTLHKGERGEPRRNSTGLRAVVQKLEMSRILADISWIRGELIFDSSSLQDIVQQFNRYNQRPQIEIQDPAIGALKMSGVFRARDPLSFIDDLQAVESHVHVMRANGQDGDIILGIQR